MSPLCVPSFSLIGVYIHILYKCQYNMKLQVSVAIQYFMQCKHFILWHFAQGKYITSRYMVSLQKSLIEEKRRKTRHRGYILAA